MYVIFKQTHIVPEPMRAQGVFRDSNFIDQEARVR